MTADVNPEGGGSSFTLIATSAFLLFASHCYYMWKQGEEKQSSEHDTSSPSNEEETPSSSLTDDAPVKTSGKPSAKKLVVEEMLQTEINYCRVMSDILTIFRDGVEDTEQPGGAMLSNTDSKIIFGKIPPILEVHEEIKTDLENLLENWSDDVSVADVILSKVEKLRSAYPPFVNYFDKTAERITACMKSDPRFQAFLKECLERPECGRLGLVDMMLNIIQRLPRIELLLQQMHKYTDKNSTDYRNLELAQSELKQVTTHINEDKRIADGRMELFEIMNNINNCPAHLLSASRKFIQKLDVDEVSDLLAGRGEHLTIFLFSDCLEIVKRRKSGKTAKDSSLSRSKSFKHLEFITLQNIRSIIDVTLDEDESGSSSSPIFCLLCRPDADTEEKHFTFQIPDPENVDKMEFMNSIAKQISNNSSDVPDYETFITAQSATDLNIKPLDGQKSGNSVTKVVSKFGKRLSKPITIKGTKTSKNTSSLSESPSRQTSADSSEGIMLSAEPSQQSPKEE